MKSWFWSFHEGMNGITFLYGGLLLNNMVHSSGSQTNHYTGTALWPCICHNEMWNCCKKFTAVPKKHNTCISNDPKFLDRHVWANSIHIDQTVPEGQQCSPRWNCSKRSVLIRVYTVCHSFCISWMHYSMVKPPWSNFKVTEANFKDFVYIIIKNCHTLYWSRSWRKLANNISAFSWSDMSNKYSGTGNWNEM